MDITLDVKNTEDIIFKNKKVMSALPKYQPLFQTWLFSSRTSALASLRINTVLEFLKLVTSHELAIISEIVNKTLVLDPNIYSMSKNSDGNLENIVFLLQLDFIISDMCISRSQDKIGVTVWN